MQVYSSPTKSRRKKEKFDHDVFHTLAAHAGLAYDVTDIDFRVQNGGTPFFFFFFFSRLSDIDFWQTGQQLEWNFAVGPLRICTQGS